MYNCKYLEFVITTLRICLMLTKINSTHSSTTNILPANAAYRYRLQIGVTLHSFRSSLSSVQINTFGLTSVWIWCIQPFSSIATDAPIYRSDRVRWPGQLDFAFQFAFGCGCFRVTGIWSQWSPDPCFCSSLPHRSMHWIPFRNAIGWLYLHDGRGKQRVRLQRRVVRQLLHHRRLRQLQILIGQQSTGRSRLDVPLTAYETGGRGIPGAVAGRQTVLGAAHAADCSPAPPPPPIPDLRVVSGALEVSESKHELFTHEPKSIRFCLPFSGIRRWQIC